jgi:hypothetical protein
MSEAPFAPLRNRWRRLDKLDSSLLKEARRAFRKAIGKPWRHSVKRPASLAIVLALSLALVACGGSATSPGGASGAATSEPNTPLARTSQLAVGLIKLEGTANAVTTSQAATLLPLWQAYASLLSTSTSAQAEYEGLQNQIEAAMTADQLKAIDAMKLTQGDMQAAFQGFGGGGPSPQGTPRASTGNSGGRAFPDAGGEGAGGGPPPGGGGGFAGGGGGFAGDGGAFVGPGGAQGTPSAAQQSTLQARIAAAEAISKIAGIDVRMVNLVVRFLETKVYGTPTPAPMMTPSP